MSIDTLAFVKRLEEAGISRGQAEAHAEAMRYELFPQLASQQDIERLEVKIERLDAKVERLDAKIERIDAKFEPLEAKFDTKIDGLRHELKAEISSLRADTAKQFGDMTMRMGGIVGGFCAILFTLLKLT